MKRDGEQIIFSLAECMEFEVLSPMPAVEAVITAQFRQQDANETYDRALGLHNNNNDARSARRKLEFRAGRLSTFAADIFKLCPDEHRQLTASPPTNSSTAG